MYIKLYICIHTYIYVYIYISNDEALSSKAKDKDNNKRTSSQSSSIYSFAKPLKERYSLFASFKLGLLLQTILPGLYRNNVGTFFFFFAALPLGMRRFFFFKKTIAVISSVFGVPALWRHNNKNKKAMWHYHILTADNISRPIPATLGKLNPLTSNTTLCGATLREKKNLLTAPEDTF